jgi:phage gp46-like protein
MSSDVRFQQQLDFPAYAVQLDWLMTDLNLIADGYDLQSAVIVALGTDAVAPPDMELPDPDATDRRGWWGDMEADAIWQGWPVGCLLWLLSRAKIVGVDAREGATLTRVTGWTRDAMRPFLQRRIASRIDVEPAQTGISRIDVGVTIYRGPNKEIDLLYSDLWDDLKEGR